MTGRSYEVIDGSDLARLAQLAQRDRDRFFEGRPEYRERLLCVALCQGAGLHYVDNVTGAQRLTGVKDFDVWSFFADVPHQRFPADRRNMHVDFGASRFGRWRGEGPRFRHYKGRRVDLFLRGLPVPQDANPVEAVRAWLAEGRTKSAKLLAAKGVVLIEPRKALGEIIWPLRLDLVKVMAPIRNVEAEVEESMGGNEADATGAIKREPLSNPSPEGFKTCPDCSEEVRSAAKKCRFCGHLFEPADKPGERNLRATRRAIVRDLAEQGNSPAEIGRLIGLNEARVRQLLQDDPPLASDEEE